MQNTGKGKRGLALGEPEPVSTVEDGEVLAVEQEEDSKELLARALKRIEALEAERNTLIEAKEKAQAKETVDPKAANESRASTKARYRIIIEEGREKNAPTHVFVGVNGRGYSIRRGVAVDVPPEVVENLKDAVEVTQVAIVDDDKGLVVGTQERQVRRFPFTILGKSRDAKGNKLMPDDAVTLDGRIM